MNTESHIVVIKAREYRTTPRMLDAIADEWAGMQVQLTGGLDDIHYEFQQAEHADGFRNVIRAYKL